MANNTVSYAVATGGKTSDFNQAYTLIEAAVQLPGAFGGNVLVWGVVQAVTGASSPLGGAAQGQGSGGTGGTVQPAQTFGGAIAMPAVPGGGLSLNWIIQVNYLTGVASVKAGTAAATGTQVTPSPDPNNLTVFTHTITNGDLVPWLRAPTLPESWP